MTKTEFETRVGLVSNEDYRVADMVYMYHPLIDDKDDIAAFWKLGGRLLMEDMLARALKTKDQRMKIDALKRDLRCRNEEIKALGLPDDQLDRELV